MKLLFDANLPPSLVRSLFDIFPESSHVYSHGDIQADDVAIWNVAQRDGFVIATKDTELSRTQLAARSTA